MQTLRQSSTRWWSKIAVGAAVLLVGCVHVGPATVARDRFDFGTAVAESWKQQTLLSIVKLRYLDVPVFLNVGQIVSGYTLETGVTLSGQIAPVNRGDSFGALGGHSIFTDRPTITYTPMTGDAFLSSLISPIPTASILRTVQSGYAADFILGWTVESLNGLQNRSVAPGVPRDADPKFVRALELMREIQMVGGVTLGVEKNKDKSETTVAVFHAEHLPPATRAKSVELRRLLGLSTTQSRFQVATSPGPGAEGELAMQPRSLFQVLQSIGEFIEVPPEHLAQHWAIPGADLTTAATDGLHVRIHQSLQKPTNAFAAVQYQGHWFWVDQGDWQTKRIIGFAITLFTLTENGGAEHLPVLTIPTS